MRRAFKIPAILHLTRLGYQYIYRSEHNNSEENTSIFKEIFLKSAGRIDLEFAVAELEKLTLKLDYDDLCREFYKALTITSGKKLIEFKNFINNEFHLATELTCEKVDEEIQFTLKQRIWLKPKLLSIRIAVFYL